MFSPVTVQRPDNSHQTIRRNLSDITRTLISLDRPKYNVLAIGRNRGASGYCLTANLSAAGQSRELDCRRTNGLVGCCELVNPNSTSQHADDHERCDYSDSGLVSFDFADDEFSTGNGRRSAYSASGSRWLNRLSGGSNCGPRR